MGLEHETRAIDDLEQGADDCYFVKYLKIVLFNVIQSAESVLESIVQKFRKCKNNNNDDDDVAL